MKIILGSQSPRRSAILKKFNLPFEQISSSFDEQSIKKIKNHALFAQKVALGKAKALEKQYQDATIITCDTIVSINSLILEKPENLEDAARMLQLLSGRAHTVITAVCVLHKADMHIGFEKTRVFFKELSKKHIEQYLSTGHFADAAGSYSIGNSGALFVEKIIGCYYNVLGLPIQKLEELLNKVSISLWDHLIPS